MLRFITNFQVFLQKYRDDKGAERHNETKHKLMPS